MDADDAPDFLDPLSAWPTPPPPRYRGQLDPKLQSARRDNYRGVRLEDCTWYHTTELEDGTVLQGEWDLRGREADYLGGVDLKDRDVLEFGPATGHLTCWMEAQGARVTAFEVGYDARVEMVPPVDGSDLGKAEARVMAHVARTTNAWWYLQQARSCSARLVHGDIYDLPEDLGTFDVSVLGCILVHLRDPYRALAQAAAHTTETIVVAEQLDVAIDGDDPVMRFGPDPDNPGPSVMWWHLSPGAVTTMLWRLGFERRRVVRHVQEFHVPGTPDGSVVELPLYTVVAERSERPRLEPAVRAPDVATRLLNAPDRQDLRCDPSATERQLTQTREELARLRATRTFRWTALLRRAYASVRRSEGGPPT